MTVGRREHLLFFSDLRHSFSSARIPLLVVFAAACIAVVVQRGDLPSLIVVVIFSLSTLDSQFNNVLYRSPGELEALTLFPLDWRGLFLARNLATAGAAVATIVVMSVAVLYFSPRRAGLPEVLEMGVYFPTVLFPLLIIGNLRSVQEPRSSIGTTRDHIVQGFGMIVLTTALTLPYIVFHNLFQSSLASLAYGAIGAFAWWRYSIPHAASLSQTLLVQP
jgi:hypothetical protein